MTQPAAPYLYAAFGLTIASDLAMPELSAGSGAPDVTVALRSGPDPLEGCERLVRMHLREDREDRRPVDEMAWRGVGSFVLEGDNLISVTGAPGTEGGFLSLPFLGPVMALLLHRRGRLVLHGSAVKLSDGAAIFLGDKGAGKSTTAAALVRSGGKLLTDDLVALETESNIRLWPGYAQIKLTKSAAAAISLPNTEPMPSPHPDFPKQRRKLLEGVEQHPLPVTAIYVLERGGCFKRDRIHGAAAWAALMRFSYLTRFGDTVLRGEDAARHLRQCATVASGAPVYRLTVPDGLGELRELAAFLSERVEDTDSIR